MKSKVIRLIAIYEIIGGLVGLYILVIDGFSITGNKLISLSFIVFMLILEFFSLRGGFLLLKQKEAGVAASLIIQICQIPFIVTSDFRYEGSIGIQILVGIQNVGDISRLVIYHSWIPHFQISFNNGSNMTVLAINIIPIIIISQIIRIRKKEKKNKLEKESLH